MSPGARVERIADVDVHIEGDGATTVLMLHGWPDTYRLWDASVAALRGSHRCVRFSLPGYEAGDARRARTLDEILSLIDRVVDRVAPGGKVVLMLHDWGCFFGYQYYARHPQRVARIIGVDIGDPASLRREATARVQAMIFAYQAWLALAWTIGGRVGDRMTRTMAERARAPSEMARIHSGMCYPYFLLWFGGARSYRRQVKAFRPQCPTLFVYGRRKPFMFHARSWLAWLKEGAGNRVEPFDTGHWVMLEAPERFNALVRDWLSGG